MSADSAAERPDPAEIARLERSLRFRDALASFPSGVTIVTTAEEDGSWRGFTATSFCSVSADPPLVLVCLAKAAQSHAAFMRASRWVVNMVASDHTGLADLFATSGADKFVEGRFTANADGLPVLDGALVVLECQVYARYEGGDHTILVGRVIDSTVGEDAPVVYYQRSYHSLPS